TTTEGRALSRRRGIAHVIAQPVVGPPTAWSSDVKGAGDSATMQLKLPRGVWDLSLQYVSRQNVTVSWPGFARTLPANLARIRPVLAARSTRRHRSPPGEV